MPLQYKFFAVPIPYGLDDEETLNAFLKSVRLVHVHREIVCQDARHYWAVAVEYLSGAGGTPHKTIEQAKKKIDYKEILSPEDFAVFSKLREWRKVTAIREAIQLYAVFMNEQIAAMVKNRVTSKAGLLEIDVIGSARVSKYGDEVLAILRESFPQEQLHHEESQEPVPQDSSN